MVIAADYPFLSILETMILFFLWVAWIWAVVAVLGDVFRRHDISGWGKAGWTLLLIVLPFLGLFAYLVSQSEGMAERALERQRTTEARFDERARPAAYGDGAATEIEKAKQLLDSGAISERDFEAIKQKALA